MVMLLRVAQSQPRCLVPAVVAFLADLADRCTLPFSHQSSNRCVERYSVLLYALDCRHFNLFGQLNIGFGEC